MITSLNAEYRSMQGLKGRPPTFKKASFETEGGGSRYLNFDLDTCLTLSSLVSRLVLLLETKVLNLIKPPVLDQS